ncbi:MAG TPA: winged helix-turn-helix transcriptional regulator, partial [Candidatus Aenigmarchaeota archaeon]|nr:winged helix-turn-helix transcriptional regulator [Candidatus Aenigmarchaeota archaeon]
YYTTIDPSKFGYKAYRVYIKTQNLTLEREREIIGWLVNNKRTWWVLSVSGKYDIDILWWVKDDYEFEEEWLNFSKNFREHIDAKHIQIYTRLYHFHRAYLIDKKIDDEPEHAIFSRERIKLDETDFKILRELSVNARESLVSLSARIGISPKNIYYRINRLIKEGVIVAFRAKINLEKIGYRYYKIEINLNNYSNIQKLYNFAKLHPYITYVNQVIGLADFDFDVEVPTERHLFRLIDEIRAEFGKDIRDIAYLTIKKVYKISYFPLSEFPLTI